MNGKSGILLSSVTAATCRITEIPEKEAIAPAAITEASPSIPAQEKTPAVISKKPEKIAFSKGLFSAKPKTAPPNEISRTPQAITIKAHIRKQLSAAEIIDSTIKAELLL